ncbi:MAG: GNAT family N-acetyltransferase [Butyrivibrio sp.]|nr:GNAT family N-acetyltransferase [Butyrivibrio sp.]
MTNYIVRNAYKSDWDPAIKLAWETFLKFDAPDFSQEGINNFSNFINDDILYKLFLAGNYQLFVAYDNNELIGMLSLRERKHISLLFVDSRYHKKGIGSSLISFVKDYCLNEEGVSTLTVNSSPYATGFYHRLGFINLEDEISTDGIRYTPMKLMLSEV